MIYPTISEDQENQLFAVYQRYPHSSDKRIKALAKRVGLDPDLVTEWFRCTRMEDEREKRVEQLRTTQAAVRLIRVPKPRISKDQPWLANRRPSYPSPLVIDTHRRYPHVKLRLPQGPVSYIGSRDRILQHCPLYSIPQGTYKANQGHIYVTNQYCSPQSAEQGANPYWKPPPASSSHTQSPPANPQCLTSAYSNHELNPLNFVFDNPLKRKAAPDQMDIHFKNNSIDPLDFDDDFLSSLEKACKLEFDPSKSCSLEYDPANSEFFGMPFSSPFDFVGEFN